MNGFYLETNSYEEDDIVFLTYREGEVSSVFSYLTAWTYEPPVDVMVLEKLVLPEEYLL